MTEEHKLNSSPTLAHIMSHWNQRVIVKIVDEKSETVEHKFPFNIEEFCRENDNMIQNSTNVNQLVVELLASQNEFIFNQRFKKLRKYMEELHK